MTIQERIDEIISRRYNNYNGSQFNNIKSLHEFLRAIDGDKVFLEFLEEAERINPKPIFKLYE